MKKILVITAYWKPWNAPGTFRWLRFGNHISFDVLTTRKPKRGFYDETIETPQGIGRVYRFGYNMAAILWGMLASIRAYFIPANIYVFSSPPESLLIGAYLFQLTGKKVIVDMRDAISRERQRWKLFVPIYKWFYGRMKNVVVSWQFLDETKPVIRNGYDDLVRRNGDTNIFLKSRLKSSDYATLLEYGFIPDYSNKPKGYAASSYPTIKHLGYKVNQKLHPETESFEPESWQKQADKYREVFNDC